MPKLTGEEKQFWERVLLAVVASGRKYDAGAVNYALRIWRENCEQEPAEEIHTAAYQITPEEQRMVDALPAAPPGLCECGHPFTVHREGGCFVTKGDDYCACNVTGLSDHFDYDLKESLSGDHAVLMPYPPPEVAF